MSQHDNDLDTESSAPLKPDLFHILLALDEEERHGYGIIKEVEQRTEGRIRLEPSPLYRRLKRLLDTGIVEESAKRPAPELDDERRRYYRLREAGRRMLAADACSRLATILRARVPRVIGGLSEDISGGTGRRPTRCPSRPVPRRVGTARLARLDRLLDANRRPHAARWHRRTTRGPTLPVQATSTIRPRLGRTRHSLWFSIAEEKAGVQRGDRADLGIGHRRQRRHLQHRRRSLAAFPPLP